MKHYDVIVIGAGAAGLMCAIEAGKRGRSVLLIDHANKVGKKILMSGGGRCNFTNYYIEPERYISHNPHFHKSALSRYTQWDFIKLVESHNIPYHEKTLGQLFCDDKAKDIVNMLLVECGKHKVQIRLKTSVNKIEKKDTFIVTTSFDTLSAESLVIATGGLSIPTMGASPFGYEVAKQFGLKVWPTRAALVPFTLQLADKEKYAELSGISAEAIVSSVSNSFQENILFTHRGLSGPAILQISSYWNPGETVGINFFPNKNLKQTLLQYKQENNQQKIKTILSEDLSKRMLQQLIPTSIAESTLSNLSHKAIEELSEALHNWEIKPGGTEGYRTAEVTLGGVDCDAVSSKTMECNTVPNLYFIGEVLDVAGWLGGYNFQWAWASAHAAGTAIAAR